MKLLGTLKLRGCHVNALGSILKRSNAIQYNVPSLTSEAFMGHAVALQRHLADSSIASQYWLDSPATHRTIGLLLKGGSNDRMMVSSGTAWKGNSIIPGGAMLVLLADIYRSISLIDSASNLPSQRYHRFESIGDLGSLQY